MSTHPHPTAAALAARINAARNTALKAIRQLSEIEAALDEDYDLGLDVHLAEAREFVEHAVDYLSPDPACGVCPIEALIRAAAGLRSSEPAA